MNYGQYAHIMMDSAKQYRKDVLIPFVTQHSGRKLDEQTVREMLEPFVEEVKVKLPDETQQLLLKRFAEYVPDALESIWRNSHMHNAQKAQDGELVTQNSADAILIGLVNYACMPLDVGMYAEDLIAA